MAESLATADAISGEVQAAPATDMLVDLYRLIEALDRRVPRLERSGEAQIAHDAAALRERAITLIRLIESGS